MADGWVDIDLFACSRGRAIPVGQALFEAAVGRVIAGHHGDTLAAEEDEFVLGIAKGVGFGEDFAAGAVPIELAVGFGDAAAGGVVEIGDARGGFHLAFGVIAVGDSTVVLRVTGSVVGETRNVVVSIRVDA